MNVVLRRTALIASAGFLACGSPNFVPVHNPVVTVRLTPAVDSIPFGGSVTLRIQTLDVSGDPTVPDHPTVWSSLNTAVFNVDSIGDVTSHWYGQGTIRAVADGVEGDAVVVARAPLVTKVTLVSPTPRVERGDTLQFQATAINEALLTVPTTGALWFSSDSTKLRVDSTGRGIAAGVGPATVRVMFAGLSDSTVETVLVPATSITIAPDSARLAFGASDTFQVTVRDSAGDVLLDRPVAVTTSPVVQAPPAIGPPATTLLVRGVKSGTGEVRVAVGRVRDSATVTVDPQHLLVFSSAVAGGAFTCGLTVDSTAYCWGSGVAGELGTGDTATGPQPRPVAGGLKFRSLTAGPEFACGLTGAGAAYCWGNNATGQLGTTGGSSPVPAAVSGGHQYTTMDAHLSIPGDSISGGVCAVDTGGQVYCWGLTWGTTPISIGAGVVDQLALGALGYCGNRSADTAALCWSFGSGPSRLPGWDSLPLTLSNRGGWAAECGISRRKAYCGGFWAATSTSWHEISLTPSNPVNSATEVAAGQFFACVNNAGTLTCRGDNTYGQLGTNTGATFVNAFLGVASPPPGAVGLVAGWSHSCVFGSDGLLYCWGDNREGQAGSTTPVMVLSPQPVLGQTPAP